MSNSNTVKFSDGREVLLSYGVPVAAFVPGGFVMRPGLPRGYVRRARKFSVTTSKHANGFAGKDSPELDEVDFAAAVAPLEVK